MLELSAAREIIEQIAADTFGVDDVEHVDVASTSDSLGEDALRIMVVLQDDMPDRLSGDQIIDFLFAVRQRLEELGEARLPIIEYATPSELALDAAADGPRPAFRPWRSSGRIICRSRRAS